MQMCFLSYYRSTCTIPSVLPLGPQVKSISSLYRNSAPVKVMLFPCWRVMLKVAGLVWPMRCKRKCAGCDSGNAVFLQIPQGVGLRTAAAMGRPSPRTPLTSWGWKNLGPCAVLKPWVSQPLLIARLLATWNNKYSYCFSNSSQSFLLLVLSILTAITREQLII